VMPALMTGEAGDSFREVFLRNFTIEHHLAGLAEAFLEAEQAVPLAMPGEVPGLAGR
jgi:hypothetical protein